MGKTSLLLPPQIIEERKTANGFIKNRKAISPLNNSGNKKKTIINITEYNSNGLLLIFFIISPQILIYLYLYISFLCPIAKANTTNSLSLISHINL